METAKIYDSQYASFCMPQAVHKMLVHGHQVIKSKPVPIGLFSEEAQVPKQRCEKLSWSFHKKVLTKTYKH